MPPTNAPVPYREFEPNGRGLAALTGFLLGLACLLPLALLLLAPATSPFAVYFFLLIIFHMAEYLLTAAFRPDTLSFDNFLLNHSTAYQACVLMEKLDKKHGKEGSKLDEFESHLFLEKTEGALSAHEMRDALRSIDIDFDKKTSLMEFLIFIFQIKNWPYVATFVGGATAEEIRLLNMAKAEFGKAQAALEKTKKMQEDAYAASEEAAATKTEADEKKELADANAKTASEAEEKLQAAKEKIRQRKARAEAAKQARQEQIRRDQEQRQSQSVPGLLSWPRCGRD